MVRHIAAGKRKKGRLLIELAAEVNGTSNSLQGGQIDVAELVVAGNQETTVDSLESWHADVTELAVGVENQVASFSQVGSAERREGVAPEAKLTGQALERGDGDSADVAEGHVGTTGEVGQLHLKGVQVTGKVDQASCILQVVDVDGLKLSVLGDVELTDVVQRDTVQVSQTGVGDRDITGFIDTLSEFKALKLGQSSPLDRSDTGKRGEAESGQSGKAIQAEILGDGVQLRRRDGRNVRATGAAEGAVNLLHAVEGNSARDVLVDLNGTLEGLAGGVAVGIGLAGNLDGLTGLTTLCANNQLPLSQSCHLIRWSRGDGVHSPAARTAWAAASAGRAYLRKAIAKCCLY